MRRISIVLLSLAAGCSGGDGDDNGGPPEWRAVFKDQRSGLLRAWGNSANDVYVVGADGEGRGPEFLHYDGDEWKRLSTGAQGDLWWVQSVGPDDVRAVGNNGLVLKYTPSKRSFEVRQAPTDLTLFGVWGSSSNDVWYVGGDTGRNRGVILRDDGNQIVEVQHTSTASAAFFKVYGFASDAVWFVGQRGTALFFDGTELKKTDTPTVLPLMGVHGTAPDRVWAVGGGGDGVILAWDGTSWKEETPSFAPQLFGIWVSGDRTFACGFNGWILERKSDGTWEQLPDSIPTFQDLHSIWVDEKGAIWATGGRLAERPPSGGVLIRYGSPISEEVAQ